MEEQASFEARAVLAPRRARLSRLALLVPVVALAATAWAGLSGPRVDPATADGVAQTGVAASVAVLSPRPVYPATALGLEVHRLGDLQPQRFARDDVVAIAGWYVPTAVTDCPPFPALYRDGALPYLRGDKDALAFCVRSGVLYAAPPETSGENDRSNPGVSVIRATVVTGVIMPIDLELSGADASEVVVLGRFVPTGECSVAAGCRRELLVDYVAWTIAGA